MWRVRDAALTAAELIGAFAGRPNCASPQQLADFDQVEGEQGALRVGDEFTIRIPGPWDGPVRVVEVDSTGFGFVTLDGHLEAGRIRFTATDLATGCLELRIEAWARGGDHVSDVLFDRIGINNATSQRCPRAPGDFGVAGLEAAPAPARGYPQHAHTTRKIALSVPHVGPARKQTAA